jgi:hypothetical protein
MAVDPTRCMHCDCAIVDPTTRVETGHGFFCCPNCAAAMEGAGAGSNPRAPDHPEALRCAHCDSPIVDEAVMESRGDDAFCCHNCAAAMSSGAGASTASGGA